VASAERPRTSWTDHGRASPWSLPHRPAAVKPAPHLAQLDAKGVPDAAQEEGGTGSDGV
jgi:hypothetical protein